MKQILSPLEIIFDPSNPSRRFWSLESNPDPGNPKKNSSPYWEYRIEVRNNSKKTLRNVSVTVEHIGSHMPIRPIDQLFDKSKKISCDIKPLCSELVLVLQWPYPKIQKGMLAGPMASMYGPIKIIVSADDVLPTTKIFQFDYQIEPMLVEEQNVSTKILKKLAEAALKREAISYQGEKITRDEFLTLFEEKNIQHKGVFKKGSNGFSRAWNKLPKKFKHEHRPKSSTQ